ncbi:MAG: copper oxidase [Chloroflexi bacterium]|nr:MAG: copper oxidase [Chloroflexota bacterium]
MNEKHTRRRFSRRDFLKLGGQGVVLGLMAGSARWLPRGVTNLLQPAASARAAGTAPDLHFIGTDGWIYLPPTPAIPPFHPDDLAPPPFTTYIFGFRDVTGLTDAQIQAQEMKAQHSAPLFWVDQGTEFRLKLTNVGLAVRPDLFDTHTVHWHGFRNVIPFFDGEPMGSLSVPIGRSFEYVYRPHDPGTYMYHCHVEDVEHVHMGMTGLVFVRPVQNGNTALYPSGKFAYNDGDGSTGYDREFAMFLSEVWAEAHWDDSHIQLPDWTEYRPDFYLLNGRVYPDTLEPNGGGTDANGDLIPPAGRPELQYQPYSSLIQANEGERVLLRFASLGYLKQSMTVAGLKMRVVGRDATLLRGVDGTDISYETNTISIAPGESYDVILSAPPYQGPGPYDTYLLYNRRYNRLRNGAGTGYGGQMTEIRIYPAGTLPPQTVPHTYF